MGKVAREFIRIPKPDRCCALLIGDTRKHRHYVPIHIGVLSEFLRAGFILKEDIIKLQHKKVYEGEMARTQIRLLQDRP